VNRIDLINQKIIKFIGVGVCCSVLEELREEYPTVAIPVWAFTEPSPSRGSNNINDDSDSIEFYKNDSCSDNCINNFFKDCLYDL
jgi:hypothetical protein